MNLENQILYFFFYSSFIEHDDKNDDDDEFDKPKMATPAELGTLNWEKSF